MSIRKAIKDNWNRPLFVMVACSGTVAVQEFIWHLGQTRGKLKRVCDPPIQAEKEYLINIRILKEEADKHPQVAAHKLLFYTADGILDLVSDLTIR